MMVGDLGRVGRAGGELGLEAELDARGRAGVLLETEVLLQNPDDLGREAAFGEKGFPSDQRVFEGRALITASSIHCLH